MSSRASDLDDDPVFEGNDGLGDDDDFERGDFDGGDRFGGNGDFGPGSRGTEASFADRLIDQVVPGELDWTELVRTYPIPALAVAALAGFYIGRVHGERLIEAATEITDRRMRETADRLATAAEEALD